MTIRISYSTEKEWTEKLEAAGCSHALAAAIVEIIDDGLDDLAGDIQDDYASQDDVDEALDEIRERLPQQPE
jgi:hypothetical protein